MALISLLLTHDYTFLTNSAFLLRTSILLQSKHMNTLVCELGGDPKHTWPKLLYHTKLHLSLDYLLTLLQP